ncbi:hypothetical protein [Bacteroides fragilis]|uniref:hypothetical protein n=1 Tax=Bacteroides fragilis TaxID=817 RepID=UPI001C6FF5A0|nr:hypothetical protein [Bacteroides fragilis]MBW9280202.1 hypothetical protein [Bacteroides fragilis]
MDKERFIRIVDLVSAMVVEDRISEQFVENCIYGKVKMEMYQHILGKYRSYGGDFFQFYLGTDSDVNRWLLEGLGIEVEPDKYPDYDSRLIAQIVQGKRRFDIYPFETEAFRRYALFGNNNSLTEVRQISDKGQQAIRKKGIDGYGNALHWSQFWMIANREDKESLANYALNTPER